MKWLTVLGVIAIVMLARCADAACLKDPAAVWAASPHSHPRWRLSSGNQCWYAGRMSHSPQRARWERRNVHGIPAYGFVPLFIPLPRPRAERLDWLTPEEGRLLSHELLGD